MTEQNESDVFISSTGVELPVGGVSEATMARIELQVKKEFRDRGEQVDPPTYQVGADTFEHNADTIADPKTTQEEKDAWEAYLACQGPMGMEIRRRQYRTRLYKGVKRDPPQEWIEEQTMLGAFVPESPVDRKIAWLEDILVTVDDWAGVVMKITRCALEGAGEEALSATETMFQRAMGQLRRATAQRASAALQSADGDMVPSSAIPDSLDDVQVGDQE